MSVGRVPEPLVESTKRLYLDQPSPGTEDRNDEEDFNPYDERTGDAEKWLEIDLHGLSSELELLRSSMKVIWADKEILLYQTLSAAICVMVLYFYLFALFPSFDPETVERTISGPTFAYQLFPFYIVAFLVMTYFNTAAVVVATIRMRGGDHTLRDGIEAATRRLLPVFQWAGVSGLVAVLLTLIRGGVEGGIVFSWILGFAWAVVTYFVVPVLLFEEEGPITAARRSFMIVRRIWSETLDGNLGLTIVLISFGLPGLVAVLPIGLLLGGPVTMVIPIVASLSLLAIFAASLNSVLVATLYGLTRTGEIPKPASMYALVRSAVDALTEDITPHPAIVDETKPQVDTRHFNKMRKS